MFRALTQRLVEAPLTAVAAYSLPQWDPLCSGFGDPLCSSSPAQSGWDCRSLLRCLLRFSSVVSLLGYLQDRCLVGTFLTTPNLVVSIYWAAISFPSTLTVSLSQLLTKICYWFPPEENFVSSSETYVGFFPVKKKLGFVKLE